MGIEWNNKKSDRQTKKIRHSDLDVDSELAKLEYERDRDGESKEPLLDFSLTPLRKKVGSTVRRALYLNSSGELALYLRCNALILIKNNFLIDPAEPQLEVLRALRNRQLISIEPKDSTLEFMFDNQTVVTVDLSANGWRGPEAVILIIGKGAGKEFYVWREGSSIQKG